MNHDPNTLYTTRVIPFAREQVFRALAEPERCARWWGPAGFTNDFHRFDFRPGGEWKHTMRGPDGHEYPNEARFADIREPSRVVIEHLSQHHFVLEVVLTPEGSGTRIEWRQRFDTPEDCEQVAKICVPANEENLDRLEAELRSHP